MVVVPTARVRLKPCTRIIPTRYPKIDLFELVADAEEFETVAALYALGNDRIREELGLLHRVPIEDRIAGPNSAYIMAAFTHPNPRGSRFSDGSYGVFYAAEKLRVAIAETQFHLARFYSDTREPAGEFDQRVLQVDLDGKLHDLRGKQKGYAAVYSPTDYSISQRFGKELRSAGSWGIVYDSVRAEGHCVAVFRPPVLSHCRESMWLAYTWDGSRFTNTYEKRPFT